MRRFAFSVLLTLCLLGLSAPVYAQCVSLTTVGSAATQNFDTLSTTAGSTTNNLTITGWFMTETGGGARDNEQYAVDTGASNTGDTYSYGAAAGSDRALGGLQTGTLIPVIGACFTNNTGTTLTSLDVAYTGEEWRLGTTARTDQLDFAYSLNATSLTTGTWNDVNALDFITPETGTVGAKDGNAAANRTALSSSISSLSIPNGATFWIRWNDFNASGADDGLAVDDFSLTPRAVAPPPTLSVGDASILEGNAGTTDIVFNVTLSAPAPAGGVVFDIATADGTALATQDYFSTGMNNVFIPAGSSSYDFIVTIIGDTTVEPNETFFVNVTNVTGATPVDGQGIGTITNDDQPPPVVAFSQTEYLEDESQILTVRVERTGSLIGPSTVNYATGGFAFGLTGTVPATGGAACTNGVDYITTSGTLNFAAEEDFKEFDVTICADMVTDPFEGFNVLLSSPTGATLGSPNISLVRINDTAAQFVSTAFIGIGTGGDSYGTTINVTGAPTSISGLRVTLFDVNHLAADNLDVLLVGPQGQKFLLMADAGGAAGLLESATITFDDAAGQVLPDSSQIFTGRFEPTTWTPGQTNFPAPAPGGPYVEPGSTVGGPVTLASVFGGTNPNGAWNIYIRDDAGTFSPLGINGSVDGGWGLQLIAPTAAGVSVSGQVRSGKSGIAGATVTVSGGNLTAPIVVRTNSFGNYTVEGLTPGSTYVVTVVSPRFTFANPSALLNLEDSVGDVDFVAEER